MQLPNPERAWASAAATVSREEIERRIGPTTEPIEVLSGGLINLNVRIGVDRVLRIRTDRSALGKEATLSSRPWRSFRTAAVLSIGDDFLLLEYVAHLPLESSAEHGAAVGRALAEIHSTTYAAAGFLADDLALSFSFPGEGVRLGAFVRGYGRTQLSEVASLLGAELSARVAAFLDSDPLGAAGEAVDVPVLTHCDFKASNLGWTTSGSLLVLDWEYAWAGTRYMDIGHLMRCWHPPEPFVRAFADAYVAGGGILVDDWRRIAETVDLCGLLGLYRHPAARATADVPRRIVETIDR
jgi:hypothetical protein